MKLTVVLLLIAGLSFAGKPKKHPSPPSPHPVSVLQLNHSAWTMTGTWYKGNAPLGNSADGALTFAFPQSSTRSFVGYLTTVPQATATLSGTLAATVSVAVTGSPAFRYDSEPGNTCAVPATVRMLLWAAPNPNANESRWWSNPAAYALAPGSAVLSAPLTPDQWTDVNGTCGDANPVARAGFLATLANVGKIGMTFGGGCFFGHGVNVAGGTAVFSLVDMRVK